MRRYITIDGGTTNTRLYLVEDGKVTDSVSLGTGSKNAESKAILTKRVREGIGQILTAHGLAETDICCILASGMITSEFGLCTLAHTVLPAGIAELREAAAEVTLPEISSVPFFFIGGVKSVGDRLEDCDLMRGEETELVGILTPEDGACVYVLPGSHSKLIRVDGHGRICDFKTMLTGEMIAALSAHTILASSVNIAEGELFCPALFEGYRYAEAHGVNEALFKTRVLTNVFMKDAAYTYSFFLGAVLQGEIRAILAMPEERIVIGGRKQLRRAMAHLLSAVSDKRITEPDDDTVDSSTARGAVRIFEYGLPETVSRAAAP